MHAVQRILLAALITFVSAVAMPSAMADTEPAPDTVALAGPRVVLLGMTGVEWSDVGPDTPGLLALADDGAVGSNVVRSLQPAACPADGWLALSTGTRASDTGFSGQDQCRTLTDPTSDGAVRGWDDYVAAADSATYGAQPGAISSAIADAGLTTFGFGPGAAILLAGENGVVGEHAPVPTENDLSGSARATFVADVTHALESANFVVLDAGSVRTDPDVPRTEQVRLIDERIIAFLEALDAVATKESSTNTSVPTTVLAASVADAGPEPRLQLAIASGLSSRGENFEPTLLTSGSTRQPAYVQTHDFTALIANRLELTDLTRGGVLIGSPLTQTGTTKDTGARIDGLVDDALKSVALRATIPPFYVVFIAINLILFAGVSLGITRLGRTRAPGPVPPRSVRPLAVLQGLRVTALAIAALPLASYMANLTPWWRAPIPGLAVGALILAWILVITTVCLLPPWRRWILGPLGMLTGMMTLFLVIDVVTGARLQLTSLMGTQALVAGRFYGFNNTAFALFATVTILFTMSITNPLVARGKRRLAAGIVAVIGVVAVALNGLPSIGADFGGPPALIPGFAVLAILTAGVRITWIRIAGIFAVSVLVITGFLVGDWLRPPESRTHLGNFFQTVLDGGFFQVVGRKLEQNLGNLFGSWFTLLAAAGLVLIGLALGRPLKAAAQSPDGGSFSWLSGASALGSVSAQVPMLKPGLIALGLTHLIGFAVNDSGILIPAVGIAVALPLLIELFASWMQQQHATQSAHEIGKTVPGV